MAREIKTGIRAWATLAALLAALPALADQAPPLVVNHLGLEDGLSQNTVMDVHQDTQGFVWFATENGLNRYDGYRIRQYIRNRNDANSLGSDYIWQIDEDQQGNLWLATDGGGLSVWNRLTDTFTNYRHDPNDESSVGANAVRTVKVMEDGRVWAGTRGGGLSVFDPATGKFTRFTHDVADDHSLSSNSVMAIHRDSLGRIWVGTEEGLNRYVPASRNFVRYLHDPDVGDSLSNDDIIVVYEDSLKSLWVGTSGGLNRFDNGSGRFERFVHDAGTRGSLSNDHVRAILEDNRGRLWVGTEDGLNMLDRRNGTFVKHERDLKDPYSLSDSYIMSLMQDRGGVVWIGTRAGGVNRWNPGSWSLGHYLSDWLAGAYVMAFADDGAGHVWVGTLGAGLARVHPGTGELYRLPEHLALDDDRVMSLLRTRNGILWIGTMTGGLSRYDHRQGTLETFRANPDDSSTIGADGIMTLYEDRKGHVWAGTFGGGVAVFDPDTKSFRRFVHDANDETSLGSDRATAIVEDRSGAVWVGTDGGGLNLLDPHDGTFTRFRHDPDNPAAISADTVYALHVDGSGTLWIGTAGGGLDRMIGSSSDPDSVRFQNFSRSDGLSSNVIYGVHSDGDGYLWLSGNYGLMRFSSDNGSVKNYHRNHGLQGEEFNFGSHHQGLDGKLYFGGDNGFNAFYPSGIERGRGAPQVVLTEVRKLNEPAATQLPYPLLDKLDLAYSDDVVTFEFAAMDFAAPEHNSYAYRLDGFDTEWRYVGNEHRVTYTNLDGGDYLLRVKAANSDGVWNEFGLALPVHVDAPPWATQWAYVAYAAAALLLTLLAFQWHKFRLRREEENSKRLEEQVHARTAELEDRNDELKDASRAKSDFLARMSHEIRTPMNGVLGMVELLKGTELNPKQSRFANTIKHSADSLLQVINDILDFSKIEAGKLELGSIEFEFNGMLEDTVELLAGPAADKGLVLIGSAPPELQHRVVGDPVRLRQVLTNLIGNAIKFSNSGDVVVRVEQLEQTRDSVWLRVEVVDSGIGIAEERLDYVFETFAQADESATRRASGTGLGLSICKQLVELMGGKIGVESKQGEGSTFWFTVPLRKTAVRTGAVELRETGFVRLLTQVAHKATQEALARLFDAWGVEATIVETSEAFIKFLQAQEALEGSYDVVILDGDDAIEDSLAAIEDYRQDAESTRPSCILLGPRDTDAASSPLSQESVDAHVAKPLRQYELQETLYMLANLEGPTRRIKRNPSQAPGEPRKLRARVLVAEDNEVNQAVVEGMLTSLGCSTEIAADGNAAVEKALSGEFDLVLMDCQMPELSGFEATAEIRSKLRGVRHLPIIALTANAVEGDRARCLDAGMDDYLSKPLALEDLYAALDRWLPRSRDADDSSGKEQAG